MAQQRKLTRKEKFEKARQSPPAKPGDRQPKLRLVLGLMIAALGVILYIQTVSYQYVLDDYSAIKANYVVQKGISSIGTILQTSYRYGYRAGGDELYRPLSLVMFAIEWNIAPDKPALSHLMNILLYGLTGFALFTLLCRLYKGNYLVPFIACLLFMAHPVHTEVVANIKSRDEILSLLFGIISISWLLDYLETKKKLKVVLSAFSFLLALLAKESAITFLAVIPLMLFVFKNYKVSKTLPVLIPLIIATVVYVALRSAALNGLLQTKVMTPLDNVIVTAPDYMTRLATAIYILGRYFILLIFPAHLSMDYAVSEINLMNFGDYRVLLSFFLHLVLLVYAVIMIRKKDVIAFSILYYFITISLVSNIVIVIGTAMADRLLYLPSLGICLAVAVLLSRILKAGETGKITQVNTFFKAYSKPIGAATVLIVFCSFKTIDRNPVWETNYTLYASGVKDSPKSTRAHYLVGIELMKRAEADTARRQALYQEAQNELRRAIELCRTNFEAYAEMGVVTDKLGFSAEALSYCDTSLMLNPHLPQTLNNKGVIHFNRREYAKAIEAFSEAVHYNPRYAEGLKNLGGAYGMAGDYQNALTYLNRSLAFENKKENLPSTYYMIGITYQYLGDQAKADEYLAKSKQAVN